MTSEAGAIFGTMDGPRIRLTGELPAWVTVYGVRYEVRINQGDLSHPCYLGAHENGHWSYWPLRHSLPNDIQKAEAEIRKGFPLPVWGAETVIEICRQLVRDRVFEVCREPVAD